MFWLLYKIYKMVELLILTIKKKNELPVVERKTSIDLVKI